jgi:nucleotide-binding universal stress UspA family protein
MCVAWIRYEVERGHHRPPLAKEQKIVYTNHTPRLAHTEEALTALFCLVDDAYALLNPRARRYESLKRQYEQQARKVLDAEAERVRAASGAVAQAHLSMGNADHEIVTLAEEIGAGLIVVGSRGRGGL